MEGVNIGEEIEIEKEIYKIVNDRELEIQGETALIYETTYPIGKGKNICVGYSSARGYQPAVRLYGRVRENISLTLDEFCEVFKEVPTLERYFQEKSTSETEHKCGEIVLLMTSYCGKKIVKIKSHGSGFDIDKVILKELNRVASLVLYRLQLLNVQNFATFYNNIIHSAAQLNDKSLESKVLTLCSTLTNSENAFCLREVLAYRRNDLERDIQLVELYSQNRR